MSHRADMACGMNGDMDRQTDRKKPIYPHNFIVQEV